MKIQPRDFGLRAQKFNEWTAIVPIGTTIEEAMEQEAYSHISGKLRPGDTVIIVPEDISWRAEVIVRGSGPQWASVEKLAYYDFGKSADWGDDIADLKVQWAGQFHKFRVVRQNPDGKQDVLHHGFHDRDEAYRWAQTFLRTDGKARAA